MKRVANRPSGPVFYRRDIQRRAGHVSVVFGFRGEVTVDQHGQQSMRCRPGNPEQLSYLTNRYHALITKNMDKQQSVVH
ncbi:Uncharacterised protein [Mycobacteroides abscessus subsp. massiliense]|nr:Uncharacterised protein [Mycobacteroides abscessus subsp. massiliense]SKU20341.1 Uncharacterised protein [Mycobacteroides abscessus subsp. massiliense]